MIALLTGRTPHVSQERYSQSTVRNTIINDRARSPPHRKQGDILTIQYDMLFGFCIMMSTVRCSECQAIAAQSAHCCPLALTQQQRLPATSMRVCQAYITR